jgi:hypothetical protein
MTIDEAFAKASAQFQEKIEGLLIDFEDLLKSKGATAQEIETNVYVYRADLIVSKAQMLAALAEQLADWKAGREYTQVH